MNVSAAGRRMIEGFEGCRLHAYQDVVGVWTIGYGHTEGVRPGQIITQAEADQLFADDLDFVYGPDVQAAIGDAPTTQAQFDAMVSLAYNIGTHGFSSSTVCRLHKAGNYSGASDAFSMWNKAGGQVLPALVRRRATEAALYESEDDGEIDVVTSLDRVKAIQVVLGVKPDGSFGPLSRVALDEVLQDSNQKGL